MIMISAFSNTLTFYLQGNLNIKYALWIGFCCAIGIYVFLTVIGGVIRKYKRPSIVVIVLGIVIGLCTIVVPIVNVIQIREMVAKGYDIWAMGELC